MKKITKIEIVKKYIIRCHFDNGDIRDLDISTFLDKNGKYSNKIYDEKIFNSVQLGSLGQIYWDGIAKIKELNGNYSLTEFDISPEFAYHHSTSILMD